MLEWKKDAKVAKFMKDHKVFLIGTHTLFCEAIRTVLRGEGIEVMGMETDQQRALERVEALQPDVILVEGDGEATGLAAAIFHFIHDKAGARLISLSFTTNQLSIYSRQQKMVSTTKDLIEAVTMP